MDRIELLGNGSCESSHFILEWKNLSYTPKRKVFKGSKFNVFKGAQEESVKVLDNVNGSIESGNLVAVLGGSGSGKTSLLAAISQRIRRNLTGDILINNQMLSSREMRNISGYVPQSDVSIPTLTPYEHLYFMLQFKKGLNLNANEQHQQILIILKKLGLIECSNFPMKRMSGGEKRKLLLATSLIFDPLLLFCDEITTGLDSFQAISVIQSLRDLIGLDNSKNFNNKAVVCSVHQPSSFLFHLFTHLILMSTNGKIVFQGKIQDAVRIFENAGLPCPMLYNPAEFYVKALCEIKNEEKLQRVSRLSREETEFKIQSYDIQTHFHKESRRVCWFKQIFYLIVRSSLSGRRNFRRHIIESFLFLSTSFVIGLLYHSVNSKSQSSVQDITGALFTLVNEIVFTYTYFVIYLIPEQYAFLRRETGEELYSISAFYVSKIIILIPKVIIETLIFVGVVFLLTSFDWDFHTYFKICTSLIFAGISAMAYGFSTAGLFSSVRLTLELQPPMDLFLLILGGMYINIGSLTFPQIKYVSIFFYSCEAVNYDYWKSVENIACPINVQTEYPCLRNGTEVLEHLGYRTDSNTLMYDYSGLLVLFIIGHIIGYLGLRRIVKKEGFY
uniref:CSON001284 protein n=1 Tax=Culicoides sonorensis TaxID=179676 RepID=A0A336KXP5_CULSO